MYWWIVVYVVQELVERVEKTFAAVQGLNTLVCKQDGQFGKLARDIRTNTEVKGPLTGSERQRLRLVGLKERHLCKVIMPWNGMMQ